MTLEELLKAIRGLLELKHPLEILAKMDNLIYILYKKKGYKSNDPSSYLEYNCIISTRKALVLFKNDLDEWNLSRRTEKVSTEAYLESSFAFLHNLSDILEEDLKYVKKLRITPKKEKKTFFEKYLNKNKRE